MSLTKLEEDLNVISTLDDLPNDVTGMTSEEVKKTFEKPGNAIKTYINEKLTEELDTNITDLNTNIETHRASTDHDTRYYTKTELNPFIQGGGTKQKEEVFTIVASDNGDGTFTYQDKNNITYTGTLSATGGQIFALTQGEYILNDNRVEAIINDTLRRSTASGGLKEVDTTHIELTSPEGNGAEITFIYLIALNLASNAGLVTVTNGEPVKPYSNQVIIDTNC